MTGQNQPSITLPDVEQIQPSIKKVRGRNKATIQLVEAMREIAEESKPITGRGIGYKLFTRKLIDGMASMPKVYRDLTNARKDGIIQWEWIVDETRDLEKIGVWKNGALFARSFFYRRDLWQTQERTVEVWSEKGTIRGVLWPILAKWGVGFRVMHGFSSSTCIWDVCTNDYNDNRPLVALYLGDYDPSGLYMSECDLPKRIAEFGGDHIEFRKIALTAEQAASLPSFPAETKKADKRYKWFTNNFGHKCWELDAMDPRLLRDLVENEITALIDRDLWAQEEAKQEREKQSLERNLQWWAAYESLKKECVMQILPLAA